MDPVHSVLDLHRVDRISDDRSTGGTVDWHGEIVAEGRRIGDVGADNGSLAVAASARGSREETRGAYWGGWEVSVCNRAKVAGDLH